MAGLDVFGMVVADMKATLVFYRLLGLDIPESMDTEQHVSVPLAGGIQLMFDTIELIQSFSSYTPPGDGSHRIGLAFRCDDPADVDARYAVLTDAGYRSHLPPFDAFWGQRYATVFDPDGNPVDLYAEQ